MKNKKKRMGCVSYFIILVTTVSGIIFIPWAIRPENLREEKNRLYEFLSKDIEQNYYNAKALIVSDRSDNDIFISKSENSRQVPASLSKLFVIDYASKIADLESIIAVSQESIAMTKPGSSVAGIESKNYYLYDLFAAMLVPSGNDAAYAVADHCGGLLAPQASAGQERIDIFMENLNIYLKEQGYGGTALYDPSGFDINARTTASDIKTVTDRLLEYQWFRSIVSQDYYTAVLPDGSIQTWKNTNAFLDRESEYYNENVTGIKTGTLSEDYNLVVLYESHGKEFLICSLGSQSDTSRYDDVTYILNTIDKSDYLKQ